MKRRRFGFTIVELMVVIVVIGILAGLSTMAYNRVMENARQSQRATDMEQLLKAITIARKNTGKTLGQITGRYWSVAYCTDSSYNPSAAEPRDLDKTHACWSQYYTNLERIGEASGVDLTPLRAGDPRGNPYMWDENEGESGDLCRTDGPIRYFTGDGVTMANGPAIPKLHPIC